MGFGLGSSFILRISSFDAAPHPRPLPRVQGKGGLQASDRRTRALVLVLLSAIERSRVDVLPIPTATLCDQLPQPPSTLVGGMRFPYIR